MKLTRKDLDNILDSVESLEGYSDTTCHKLAKMTDYQRSLIFDLAKYIVNDEVGIENTFHKDNEKYVLGEIGNGI